MEPSGGRWGKHYDEALPKALFFSLPLHGHVNPSLPLVRELAARGDEIVYYAADPFAASIELTGARYRRYRSTFLQDIRNLPERVGELGWLLMRSIAEVLDQDLAEIRAERPDYVITDSVAPWGRWVGELLDVPVVTSVPTFAFNRHVLAYGVARGLRPKSARLLWSKARHIFKAAQLQRQLRRRYRAHGPGLMSTMFGCSDLTVVYTSRYFQPRAETFDRRFEFVGPSLGPRVEADPFPWDRLKAPVVYVSLGTLFNTDVAFYRNCFDAFRDAEFQVVMSLGSNVSEAQLGEVPLNFIVRSQVPQLDVLARAAAFITHGGMNSVSESLLHAVPVVVIPQMGEQELVGRRVDELGAGLFVAKDEATAPTLREAARRVLAERRFRDQAAVVRESFQAAGGVSRAAEAISTFVSPRGSREGRQAPQE